MPRTLRELTVDDLKREAATFAIAESQHDEANLFGVTDGKAVGTYLEQKFQAYLLEKYAYPKGSSAKGIDFPGLDVDIKVTSIRQPQSSCPFKSARQKVYGLGYSLLVFVYEKHDDAARKTARLNMKHTVFAQAARTGDYQTTSSLLKLLDNNANREDILAFFTERMLPLEITAEALVEEVSRHRPVVGYLTIVRALQWRLQYGRAIEGAGVVDGIVRIT